MVVHRACAAGGDGAKSFVEVFKAAMDDVPFYVVLCDMNLPGLPLTFVNKEFEKQTGYSKEEAQGQNCRMLQGPATEQEHVASIIRALQTASQLEVELTNYRKNGPLNNKPQQQHVHALSDV